MLLKGLPQGDATGRLSLTDRGRENQPPTDERYDTPPLTPLQRGIFFRSWAASPYELNRFRTTMAAP